jgi:hypothetical protein
MDGMEYDAHTRIPPPPFPRLGPALLAFTLMCCAYSLRTWRRNGVACDELLFLPGTLHGVQQGIESPLVVELPERPAPQNEGDAAAGIGRSRSEELEPILEAHGDSLLRASSRRIYNNLHSAPIPMQSLEEAAEPRDDEGDDREEYDSWNGEDEDSNDDESPVRPGLVDAPQQRNLSEISMDESEELDEEAGEDDQNELQRFQTNHPRITRIGTFFFFRTPTSATSENAAYAPSGPSVFGAALDLSMPVCFNFHLFIEAFNHMSDGDDMTAKILPLAFMSVMVVRSFIPPSRRNRFWATLKFTVMAPFHKVRFRDAFLGDVLTSLVRPAQDILFALSYYATTIYGIVFGSYGLTEAGLVLERSWILHNVILPSCALLPLWWKFLQTLRQRYDTDKRWPYLGDSFKYLSAAMVIIYGMTHPEDRRSSWWLICFVLAVMYQIAWDTCVDWELFVITPRDDTQPVECQSPICSSISSLRPSSRLLLAVQMNILQPISDAYRRLSAKIPSWEQIQLRPKRLYKNEHFYWRIFIVNVMLRFTWMLCFIPAYRLSSSSEKQATFSSDVNSYIGVLLPVAEIVRRTYWGFLKVEAETIKMMDQDVLYSRVDDGAAELTVEETPDKDRSSSFQQLLPTWLDIQQKQQHSAATSSSSRSRLRRMFKCRNDFRQQLFQMELGLWACAFVGFGYWAACQ